MNPVETALVGEIIQLFNRMATSLERIATQLEEDAKHEDVIEESESK